MDGYAFGMFMAGTFAAFEMFARNTVSGEAKTVTVYAKDGTAAAAAFFTKMDAESGDRSWVFDGFHKREA